MFAALDHLARQRLSGDLYTVPAQHRFKAMQRQPIDILGGQQHGQYAWAGHVLFDQLGRLVSGDGDGFATTATVNLANMFDHADLHRHDVQLLAGFFANDMLAAATSAGQLVFWQVVDDFEARQIGQQRLAFATALGRSNDFFIRVVNHRQQRLALRLVEHRQLWSTGINGLLGFTIEQSITQQRDLFFQMTICPLSTYAQSLTAQAVA